MMETGMYYAEEVRIFIRDEYGYYFTKQKFLNLLRNRFYCGIIEIKPLRNEPGFSLKGVHEPMVSEELFNRVQWVMNNRKNPKDKVTSVGRISASLPVGLSTLWQTSDRVCQQKQERFFASLLSLPKNTTVISVCGAAVAHDRLEEFFGSFNSAGG